VTVPARVGHMIELPLEHNERVLVDPATIVSVTAHRSRPEITVVRCQEGTSYTGLHFVAAPYSEVRTWLRDALKKDAG